VNNKYVRIALALVAIATVVFSGSTAKADNIKLRVAVIMPEASTYTAYIKETLVNIRRRTQGRVDFVIYASGVQGTEEQVLDKLKTGELDAGALTDIALGHIAPEIRMFNLPLFLRSHKEADYLMGKLFGRIAETFKEKGFVLIMWIPLGPGYMFANRSVNSIDKVKNLRVWVQDSDELAHVFASEFPSLNQVRLSFLGVRDALIEGKVDMVYNLPLGLIGMQWYPHVQFAIESPITMAGSGLVIPLSVWKRLSKQDRQTVKSYFQEQSKWFNERAQEDTATAIRGLKKAGIKFEALDPASRAEYQAISQRVKKKLIGKFYSAEFLKHVEKLLEDYRKHHHN